MIFEEETNDETYHKYYNDQNTSLSLEIQCIKKYSQKHDVKHIPVDIKPNQYLSFKEWDYVFDAFKKYDVCKRIVKQHCALIDVEGFAYLHSNKCLELFDEMKSVERQLIEFSGINKNRLLHIYQLFHREHDSRENAMLLNIYNYSKETEYSQAVFLLGYAHRKSMIQKILEGKNKEDLKLNSTFNKTSLQVSTLVTSSVPSLKHGALGVIEKRMPGKTENKDNTIKNLIKFGSDLSGSISSSVIGRRLSIAEFR